MTRAISGYVLLLAGLGLPACGDNVATSGGGSSATSSTTSTGSDGATSTTSLGNDSATFTTTDGSGTATAGASCDLPADIPPGDTAITITLTNTSTEPRYVLPNFLTCTSRLVRLALYDVQPLLWGGDQSPEGPPCNGDALCAGFGCSDSSYPGLVLSPGASHVISWDGMIWDKATVPMACADDPACAMPENLPDSCYFLRALAQGSYTATVALSETCPADGPGASCDCAADSCPIDVSNSDPHPVWQTFQATADFPQGVEILIQ